MKRAGLLITLISAGASAADHQCNLSGDGDVDLCEKVYWRSRLAAVAVPSYVIALDGRGVHHGLAWTLAVDVPKDEWSEYFSLGVARDSVPRGFPFQLGIAASFVWYVGSSVEGRLVARARIISLAWPNSPALSFAHITIGLGAAGGTVNAATAGGTAGPTPQGATIGFAPRVELRTRIGHIAWGGVVLGAGFQPYVSKNIYVADLSIGLEAPWVWWW